MLDPTGSRASRLLPLALVAALAGRSRRRSPPAAPDREKARA